MDWKNVAKAARERVAFLVQQNFSMIECANAADILYSEIKKYQQKRDGKLSILSPEYAEIATLENYERTARRVSIALEQT